VVRLGRLRAVACIVALALTPAALTACHSGSGASKGTGDRVSGGGEASGDAPGAGEPTGGGATVTTKPGSGKSTGTTARKGTANTTATTKPGPSNREPGPVRPPAPGVYSYRTQGSYTYGGRDHALPARTTLTIDPAAGPSQHAARNLRDVDGNGPIVETTLRYEADGLYLDLLRYTNRVDGVDDAREYRPNPPVLVAPKNADVGYKASYDAADGGTNVHVDSTIERRDTVLVDGVAVECYVVKAVTTFHGTVEGGGEGSSCVSLDYRLLLTEDVTTRFTVGPTEVRGAYRATIEHVTPS
jgi:hypothetical protein